MEKLFKLKANNTTVRTEIIGGLTTFFAMAYIIFVNPTYLSATGMDASAVLVATCISSAIGTLLTAFLANVPFAQAPGMGLNAFFAFTVCGAMGYTWQQALTVVLISGILFLVITLTPLRSKVIAGIPNCIKAAISAGIGLFIALIGLLNSGAGVIHISEATAFLPDLNNITSGAPLLIIIGLIITATLMAWKVKGALVLGIIVTTIIGIPMGITTLPESLTISGANLTSTMFQFDFTGVFANGILPLFIAVISFFMVDCFDTIGTLLGAAGNAGMLDENGNMPGGDRALIADAIATCVGACLGTSTVTTYVESSAGISEGARTGLSSVVTGVLFLIAVVLAPIAGIIPGAATAPALIIVGVLMIKGVSRVNWDDFEEALPCFLTVALMPLAYSISDGIGFGLIFYTIIKMVRGKFKEVPVVTYVLSVLFIAMYILSNVL